MKTSKWLATTQIVSNLPYETQLFLQLLPWKNSVWIFPYFFRVAKAPIFLKLKKGFRWKGLLCSKSDVTLFVVNATVRSFANSRQCSIGDPRISWFQNSWSLLFFDVGLGIDFMNFPLFHDLQNKIPKLFIKKNKKIKKRKISLITSNWDSFNAFVSYFHLMDIDSLVENQIFW